MTCYVDPPTDYGDQVKGQAKRWGSVWSHLMCTTRAELDAMAVRLGLKTGYRQHDDLPTEHYDLIPSKRRLAITLGVVPCSSHDQVNLVVVPKMEAQRGQSETSRPDGGPDRHPAHPPPGS